MLLLALSCCSYFCFQLGNDRLSRNPVAIRLRAGNCRQATPNEFGLIAAPSHLSSHCVFDQCRHGFAIAKRLFDLLTKRRLDTNRRDCCCLHRHTVSRLRYRVNLHTFLARAVAGDPGVDEELVLGHQRTGHGF